MKTKLFFIFLFTLSITNAQYNFDQIDIWSGSSGSSPKHLTEYNNEMYFQAFELTPSFTKLYKSDGTIAGTSQVAPNLNGGAGYSPTGLTVFNGELIFTAFVSGLGNELYKTDGTEAGTILLKDVRTGNSSGLDSYASNNNTEVFIEFNGELYFRGSTNSSIELWKTDGTPNGTVSVKNFEGTQTGAPIYVSNGDQNYLGVVFNNEMYFSVNRSGSGSELWKTDGTTAGTVLVKDGYGVAISNLIVFDNQLFFTAGESATGKEIWTTDGTTAGTQIKHDIFPNNLNPFFGFGSSPDHFFIFNNEMYFAARSYDQPSNTIIGTELWKTDGTTASLVKNINTYVSNSVEGSGLNLPRFKIYQNELYFTGKDDASGFDLWKTDGTSSGTVKAISESDTGITFEFLNSIEYNGKLFYFNFQNLWVTDGTPTGTEVLTDSNGLNSDILSVQTGSLFQFNNKLWFAGSSNANGTELTSITDTTLSIESVNGLDEIKLYPNPTSNVLNIKSKSQIESVEIFNLFGQKILESKSSVLNIANLSAGHYLLRVYSNKGFVNKKIIKY